MSKPHLPVFFMCLLIIPVLVQAAHWEEVDKEGQYTTAVAVDSIREIVDEDGVVSAWVKRTHPPVTEYPEGVGTYTLMLYHFKCYYRDYGYRSTRLYTATGEIVHSTETDVVQYQSTIPDSVGDSTFSKVCMSYFVNRAFRKLQACKKRNKNQTIQEDCLKPD